MEYLLPVLAFGTLLMVYHEWAERKNDELVLLKAPAWLRWSVHGFLLLALALCDSQQTAFVYFQF
jgi:hypothetical protein